MQQTVLPFNGALCSSKNRLSRVLHKEKKTPSKCVLYITVTSTKNCMYCAFQNLTNWESIVHIVSQRRAESHSPFICLESSVLARTRSATQAANKQNIRDVFSLYTLVNKWYEHQLANPEVPLTHACKHTRTHWIFVLFQILKSPLSLSLTHANTPTQMHAQDAHCTSKSFWFFTLVHAAELFDLWPSVVNSWQDL